VIDFRKIIGYYSPNYPALDASTPYFEFLSYLECCESLGVKPNMNRFIGYNRYYNSIIKNND